MMIDNQHTINRLQGVQLTVPLFAYSYFTDNLATLQTRLKVSKMFFENHNSPMFKETKYRPKELAVEVEITSCATFLCEENKLLLLQN